MIAAPTWGLVSTLSSFWSFSADAFAGALLKCYIDRLELYSDEGLSIEADTCFFGWWEVWF